MGKSDKASGTGLEESVAVYAAEPRPVKPSVAVTLSPEHAAWAHGRVEAGAFATIDDAIAYALDHFIPMSPYEDDSWMLPLIEEARNSPEPSIPAEDVQDWLRERAAQLRQR